MPKKVFLEYKELHKWTDDLIWQIKQSKFQPDVVVSIAMGGLMIWYLLTKGLWISKFESIQVQSYDGEEQWQIKDLTKIKYNFTWMKVLLVDDLVDSWKTLKHILDKYLEWVKEVKTATWIYKKHSIIKSDFYVKEFEQEWIVFPYEIYE